MTAMPRSCAAATRARMSSSDAVVALDRPLVGDVVAVVARRLGDRHQPDAGDAEIGRRRRIAVVEVVEPAR